MINVSSPADDGAAPAKKAFEGKGAFSMDILKPLDRLLGEVGVQGSSCPHFASSKDLAECKRRMLLATVIPDWAC